MLLLEDISTSQESPKTATTITHVNMEHIDREHLCECGPPVLRGPPVPRPPFSVGRGVAQSVFLKITEATTGGDIIDNYHVIVGGKPKGKMFVFSRSFVAF